MDSHHTDNLPASKVVTVAGACCMWQDSGAWLAKLDVTADNPTITSEAKVWSGNAKTCVLRTVGDGPRLYLGTEPADVLVSDDLGASWRGTDSFAAIPGRWELAHVSCCGGRLRMQCLNRERMG